MPIGLRQKPDPLVVILLELVIRQLLPAAYAKLLLQIVREQKHLSPHNNESRLALNNKGVPHLLVVRLSLRIPQPPKCLNRPLAKSWNPSPNHNKHNPNLLPRTSQSPRPIQTPPSYKTRTLHQWLRQKYQSHGRKTRLGSSQTIQKTFGNSWII